MNVLFYVGSIRIRIQLSIPQRDSRHARHVPVMQRVSALGLLRHWKRLDHNHHQRPPLLHVRGPRSLPGRPEGRHQRHAPSFVGSSNSFGIGPSNSYCSARTDARSKHGCSITITEGKFCSAGINTSCFWSCLVTQVYWFYTYWAVI